MTKKPIKALTVTNMYPYKDVPFYGMVVKEEIEFLEKENVQGDVIFINGRQSKWDYLRKFGSLLKILSKQHYDVIHTHHTYCGFMVLVALKFLCKRIPVVLTSHEGEIFHQVKVTYKMDIIERLKYIKSFKKFVMEHVDHVIVVHKDLINGFKPKAYTVIPCGINMENFRPDSPQECRERLGINLHAKVIFFPSDYIRPEKRFHLVEDAVEILNQTSTDPIVLIKGGAIRYDLMPDYFNACDVAVLVSDYEASPMVVKEAMAVGTAVVSTDVGDVSILLQGVDNGFLTTTSPHKLAQKLQLALKSGKSPTGRQRMLDLELSETHVAAKIVKIYKELAFSNT